MSPSFSSQHASLDTFQTGAIVGPRVKTQAEAELRRSPYRALRCVSCEYTNGVLRLCGRLPSYYLKQLAQTLVARKVKEDTEIDNRVEVVAE